MMKFIELKDASFWSNKNKIMKDIGKLILAASEIAFVSRYENNTDRAMVVLRGGERNEFCAASWLKFRFFVLILSLSGDDVLWMSHKLQIFVKSITHKSICLIN